MEEIDWNNKEEVFEAVKKNPYLLKNASPALKKDKEFVLKLVKEDGAALQFVSEELKKDDDIILEAIRSYGTALMYADKEKIIGNKNIMLEALKGKRKS